MEDMIYIAVGNDFSSDKRNLLFVLQQFPGPIGILHVHSPSKLIPVLGARLPEKFARADAIEQHRRREKEKMFKLLRSYAMLCSEREVKVQYITSEDTLLGLQQLVLMNQVRKLVMASRSMSKENALLQFCQILLVRNGRHEWTSPETPEWTTEHLTEESGGATAQWNQMVDRSNELHEDETPDDSIPTTMIDTSSSSNEGSRDNHGLQMENHYLTGRCLDWSGQRIVPRVDTGGLRNEVTVDNLKLGCLSCAEIT